MMKTRRGLLFTAAGLLCLAWLAGCSGGVGNAGTEGASGVTGSAQIPSASPRQETAAPSGYELADGSYPVCLTGAGTENGTYSLKFKTIVRYDAVPDYLKEICTPGVLVHDPKLGDYYTADSWDLEKYYDSHYPVVQYRDGKTGQIDIQEVPGILGMTKAEFLKQISDFQNEDDNVTLYAKVGDSEYDCVLSENCGIEVSGALAKQPPAAETLRPEELVSRVSQYFKDYGDSGVYYVTLKMENEKIADVREVFHP